MEMNVLIADDEKRLRILMRDYLKRENYNIFQAEDGQEALDIFFDNNIDVIILDIMMPKKSGWEVATEIRSLSDVPILMLTAKGEEEDKLKGFKLGTDEYVTKPFSPKVLVARLKALLKRAGIDDKILKYGDLKIDMKADKVFSKDELIDLSPKEYKLLKVLTQNEGISLDRDTILNKVWGYNYFGDFRTVDTHIKRLRKKLGFDYIKTVRGIGYRFEVE
ncbi:MAG: response regulator transcription factor [Fusobacteriota bacterium]